MNFSSSAVAGHLHKHRHLIDWVRLLAGYSFVQAIAQGLGFLAGIMVVRTLPKEDYAWFMIVNTISPIMNQLSDSGITNSLSAIGGKFWQDDVRMGSLIKTAMSLRRYLLLFCFIIITPVLVLLLWHNHAPVSCIAWLIPITLAGVFFQLNTGVLGVVVNLRQQVGRLQTLAFMGVLPRLAVIALLAAFGWLNAPLAIAAGTIALAVQYWLLEQWVRPQLSGIVPANQEFRKGILAIVKRQAPLTIYTCLQGQIGIWLISIFGNVQRVAELGALGRIGMLFSLLVPTITAIIIPRFARCQDPGRLRYYYTLILSVLSCLIMLGVVFAWLLPGPLLWLLGAQYAQLGDLVWLIVLASGIYNFFATIFHLNVNKGWIPPAAIIIPVEIITQVILCLTFDLSSVRDIILISLFTAMIPGLINLYIGISKLISLSQPKIPVG